MKKQINTKSYLFILTIICYSQAFTLLVFSLVVIFIGNQTPQEELASTFQYIVPAALLAGLILGHLVFRFLVARINNALPLKEKTSKYLTAIIVRSAFLEVPGLFAAVVAFITGEIIFLGATAIIFLTFLALRPTKNSIVEDLRLSPEERSLFDDPNAIIAEVTQRSN